jgi:hypothetical protein
MSIYNNNLQFPDVWHVLLNKSKWHNFMINVKASVQTIHQDRTTFSSILYPVELHDMCSKSSWIDTVGVYGNMEILATKNIIYETSCTEYVSVILDVPHMRQADISFALTVVLHAMSPPVSKTAPVTAQNIKTASEMRAGSLTYSGRSDNKKQHKVSTSLFQVSFLGMF